MEPLPEEAVAASLRDPAPNPLVAQPTPRPRPKIYLRATAAAFAVGAVVGLGHVVLGVALFLFPLVVLAVAAYVLFLVLFFLVAVNAMLTGSRSRDTIGVTFLCTLVSTLVGALGAWLTALLTSPYWGLQHYTTRVEFAVSSGGELFLLAMAVFGAMAGGIAGFATTLANVAVTKGR